MKISIDHVTNSSSESFGTVIVDTVIAIGMAVPFIAVTLTDDVYVSPDEESSNEENEDNVDYEPYVSTDPKDPPGTIIQNNRDGSITKTHPDGAVGTKMPDGTIYVTEPDGTTGIIEPDGHQIMNLPDGTKIEHYTDGTSYAEYPDGTKRVEYEDGTVREQKPDGETVTVNPDGSFEVREADKSYSKTYDPDGRFKGMTNEFGTDIKVDDDNNVSGKYINEKGDILNVSGNTDTGLVMENGEGTRIETDENGEIKHAIVKDENGYLEIKHDGSIKSEGVDPKTGVSYEFDFDPERGLKFKNSNGDYIDIDADGKGSAHISNEEGEMTLDKKGNFEIKDKHGNYERYTPNEDGSASWERGNKEGAELTGEMDTEGNVTYTASDGSQLVVKEDSLTVVDSNGNQTTYTKAQLEQMVKDQQSQMKGVEK